MRSLDKLHLKPALVLTAIAIAAGTLPTQAASSPGSPAATNTVPVVPAVEIPQSVFLIPNSPKEGRTPFFPRSVAAPTVAPKPLKDPYDPSAFILNGITSPPKPLAMINNYTFEPGEEHEIKRAGGAKVLVKCVEIKADSAVISVGGQLRELKLRGGL